jgi:HEAT repeat protein
MLALRLRFVPAFVLASWLFAHGGAYVPPPAPRGPGGGSYGGPGDVTPPGGPTGPTTGRPPSGPSAPAPSGGGPSGPSAPAPAPSGTSGPSTGGGSGPSAPAPSGGMGGGATGPRGMALADDYDSWDYWWEFNKERFLNLRAEGHAAAQTGSDDFYLGATRRAEARDALRPTDRQAVEVVLPALKRALDASSQRDITTACLVAIAKQPRDHHAFSLLELATPRLRDGNQEVRETAALALGIGARGDAATLALLSGLALDSSVGRTARGSTVDERTRAFATYALGLTAQRGGDAAIRAQVFGVLRQLLADGTTAGRDTRVAAIHAIGLLASPAPDYAATRLTEEAVTLLDGYFVRSFGVGEEVVQAHCPTAIAKLLGPDDVRSATFRRRFADVLRDAQRSSRRGNAVSQSCALALGQMVPRLGRDATADDDGMRQLLHATSRLHPDRLTRNFALVAMAQVGGAAMRSALLTEFDQAKGVQRKAWCALALGLMVHAERAANVVVGPDRLIADTLHDALRTEQEPSFVGALGIALGLCSATDAADTMRSRMLASVAKEKLAGYLCVGLALMQDRRAVADIRHVAAAATRRPELLLQAAVALGRLGDKETAADLLQWLHDGGGNLAKLAALSAALARIGDRRSIDPLVKMLHDESLGALPRAFAAVALGGVCDPRDLPWNTPIGADINYRATVATLTDQSMGILDIL